MPGRVQSLARLFSTTVRCSKEKKRKKKEHADAHNIYIKFYTEFTLLHERKYFNLLELCIYLHIDIGYFNYYAARMIINLRDTFNFNFAKQRTFER